jgi:hypothetical protein
MFLKNRLVTLALLSTKDRKQYNFEGKFLPDEHQAQQLF